MTKDIRTVTVVGAGVMGAGIAAHLANAGIKVHLLDIVPKDAKDRNVVAKGAVERLLKGKGATAGFMQPSNASLITVGNIDDDLKSAVKDSDWTIEVIVENLKVKRGLFEKIDRVKKPGALVSSNTSTIPLVQMAEGRSDDFKKNFVITHFFNPPRYMRLLELVSSHETNPESVATLRDFCDEKLGKTVVECKDRPGFIANRIGTFFMFRAVTEAMKRGMKIEDVDAVLSGPLGFPKDGVFGLMDLVGIGLIPHVAQSLEDNLPQTDAMNRMDKKDAMALIQTLLDSGRTGRMAKALGGFYRREKDAAGKPTDFAIDLNSGEYHVVNTEALPPESRAKHPRKLFKAHTDASEFAWQVLRDTLLYTASLVPEICDDITGIDAAMREGFNWKKGPFELIDQMGGEWFAQKVEKDGLSLPPFLRAAGNRPFYAAQDSKPVRLVYNPADHTADYKVIERAPGILKLSDIKLAAKPIVSNDSASAWEVGDGVVCFEFHSKMNSLDPSTLLALNETIVLMSSDPARFKGLVIHNEGKNFSIGANLGVISKEFAMAQKPLDTLNEMFTKEKLGMLRVPKEIGEKVKQTIKKAARPFDAVAGATVGKILDRHATNTTDNIVHYGQSVYRALREAPFPVVGAPHEKALGGGCEILLHCDAIQAGAEAYIGLIEVGVGLIPGWGGHARLLERFQDASARGQLMNGPLIPAMNAFQSIMAMRVSDSADNAKASLFMRPGDGITMNRDRLLTDAKAKVLAMAPDYVAPKTAVFRLVGDGAETAFKSGMDDAYVAGAPTTWYDVVVGAAEGRTLAGPAGTNIGKVVTESQLAQLERENFVGLLKNQQSRDRIASMMNSKLLREEPLADPKTPDELRAMFTPAVLPYREITGKPLEGKDLKVLRGIARETAWLMKLVG